MTKLFQSVMFATLFASGLSAQAPAAPPPEPAPDTVIATVDGKKLTYGELHSYISTLSQAQAKTAMMNIEQTVKQYAMLMRLSKMGEDQKLDQKQPYIDILRAGRMQVLAQAMITEQYYQALVLPNEQEQYYKEHKDKYSKLKVKAIYLAFASNAAAKPVPGKKYRTEAEAQALAGDLVAKIRAGGDFVALVNQYSDDETSKKANGDWGTVTASDNLPDDFKRAVLALKLGQVTDPMRRTGGFYIFKADSMVEQAYSEVKDDIFNLLKDVKMRQWMDKLQESIPIKVEPNVINPAGPAAPPAGQ
jgi:peptidyl-prolyl cis-trans isomerase C